MSTPLYVDAAAMRLAVAPGPATARGSQRHQGDIHGGPATDVMSHGKLLLLPNKFSAPALPRRPRSGEILRS